jgi:hypothetical protein
VDDDVPPTQPPMPSTLEEAPPTTPLPSLGEALQQTSSSPIWELAVVRNVPGVPHTADSGGSSNTGGIAPSGGTSPSGGSSTPNPSGSSRPSSRSNSPSSGKRRRSVNFTFVDELFSIPCTSFHEKYKLPFTGLCTFDVHLQSNVVTFDNPISRDVPATRASATLAVSSTIPSTAFAPSQGLHPCRRMPHWSRRKRRRDAPLQILMSHVNDAASASEPAVSTPRHVLLALQTMEPEDPSTYKKAMESPAKAEWRASRT